MTSTEIDKSRILFSRYGWHPSVHEPPGSFGGSAGGSCSPTSLQVAQADNMAPRQQALHMARHRIQATRDAVEVVQVVRNLAMALGASRTEGGTHRLSALRPAVARAGSRSHAGGSPSQCTPLSATRLWSRRRRVAGVLREPPPGWVNVRMLL